MNAIISTIILLVVIAIGVILIKLDYRFRSDTWGFVGILVTMFSITIMTLHIIALSLMSFQYREFMAKRDAFETTLKEARLHNNPYESAAILQNISQWNVELAKIQFQNKTFLFDQYIDDRIETVKPIN